MFGIDCSSILIAKIVCEIKLGKFKLNVSLEISSLWINDFSPGEEVLLRVISSWKDWSPCKTV